ncbi:MAG: hypothetical protein U0414_39415 [Polyangiaceae bacterium]
MHSTSTPWTPRWGVGVGAVAAGALLVVLTSTPLGCENTVEKVDGSSSGSSSAHTGSSAATDMCTGAASIQGDGAGCPCGVDMCGFCVACDPCGTSADCSSPAAHCIHSDHQCGKGAAGECIEIPPGECAGIGPRVCLCDGGVETLDCASAFGLDVSDDLAPCVGGTFACGDKIRNDYVEYCRTFSGGPAPGTTTYTCVPAPAACSTGIADCKCVDEPGGACSIDMDGQVQVQILTP